MRGISSVAWITTLILFACIELGDQSQQHHFDDARVNE